ncbi:MAG: alpha/beta fold hydrolase [Pseudobdellovibrionaceae bacterium]
MEGTTEICSVQISLSGKQNMYQYEIRRAQPGYPTVIKIPGGPGQGYIGQAAKLGERDGIPKEFGIIALDPRGVGKNSFGPDLQGRLYSTAHNVKDIKEIIKAEKINSYIVHGQSYGTIVATEFGHAISNQSDIAKPLGIVLTGVAYDGAMKNYHASFNEQLNRLMRAYSSQEKKNISAGLQKILSDIYHGNQLAFAGAITQLLIVNIEDPMATRVQNIDFRRFFDLLAKQKMESDNPVYDSLVRFAEPSLKYASSISIGLRNNTMGEVIKCSEMGTMDAPDLSFDIAHVKFIDGPPDCPLKGYKLKNEYHVKHFPISGIPLYYVQGALDPATSLSGAKKHYGDQELAPKIFIEITNQSHNGLLGLMDCKEKIWFAFSNGIKAVQDLMPQCASEYVKIRGSSMQPQFRENSTEANVVGVK